MTTGSHVDNRGTVAEHIPFQLTEAPPRCEQATVVGVVIPVRNGARTLGGVLDALAFQSTSARLHIAVVLNGSTEETRILAEHHATRVRAHGHTCEIVQSQPGRARAIRAGERRLPAGDRVYVDCDAVLSDNAITALLDALRPGAGVHFAAPRLVIGPSPSRATRSYFRAWAALPYVRASPVTYGTYAVSAEGRQRWGELPLVHSDDKFARLHFESGERRVVGSASYEVAPPHGLGRLLSTRRRYLAGNRELAAAYPELVLRDCDRVGSSFRSLLRHPAAWGDGAVFLAVYGLAVLLEFRAR